MNCLVSADSRRSPSSSINIPLAQQILVFYQHLISSRQQVPTTLKQSANAVHIEMFLCSNIKKIDILIGNQDPYYRFLPARIREICRPRLKAVLKSSRVWMVETKGSQARTATGAKITIPIPYSYVLAMGFTESHSPSVLRAGLKTREI